tara:strand:+ start:225 stop:800 length:576 start_codon:yes stop_codon:yes gene_type:complete
MHTPFPPSQHELNALIKQRDELKQQQQLGQLKEEIQEITQQVINKPNEFEGSMQVQDSYRALHTKRKRSAFTELVIARIISMISLRPVIGNLIAIGLVMLALVFLHQGLMLSHLARYQHYMGVGLMLFAGLQIIKSGTRSICLPLISMILGAMISHQLKSDELLFTYGRTFYQYVMMTGIAGVAISVLTID